MFPSHNLALYFSNAAMGAVFTGVARAAYEAAMAYTRSRVQGGKPISEHQLVQKHLFDMFTKVETCRALSRATTGLQCDDAAAGSRTCHRNEGVLHTGLP